MRLSQLFNYPFQFYMYFSHFFKKICWLCKFYSQRFPDSTKLSFYKLVQFILDCLELDLQILKLLLGGRWSLELIQSFQKFVYNFAQFYYTVVSCPFHRFYSEIRVPIFFMQYQMVLNTLWTKWLITFRLGTIIRVLLIAVISAGDINILESIAIGANLWDTIHRSRCSLRIRSSVGKGVHNLNLINCDPTYKNQAC